MNSRIASSVALLLALSGTPVLAQDDLGLGRMWTFHNPPLAYLEEEYGFAPDQDWFTQVQLASLRFGRGCSASFVSPRGLILTNHHCARGNIADAQGEANWVRDGFVAGSLEEEVRLPGLTVQQLVKTTDVTARVAEGIVASDSPAVMAQKRQDNRQKILAEVRGNGSGLQPQVVELFQGAQFFLYEYRIFDDVRLVMAPHLQAAHFGGDLDNFCYPRYAIDFAFCRAYENGQPANTEGMCFGWSDGPKENDLVILTGNPGGTSRLLTKAQLEYQRDARIPRIRELIDNRIEIMRDLAKKEPETAKGLETRILSFENGQKLYRGEHAALKNAAFMERKQEAEEVFRAKVASEDRLQEQYGDVWAQLAEVAAERTRLEAAQSFHSEGGSPLLIRAMLLLDFAEDGDEGAADRVRSVSGFDDPLQRAFFVDHLVRAQKWLDKDDAFLAQMLGEASPEQAAERLQARSRLADAEYVNQLLEGGKAAIDGSQDPALQVARALRPLRRGAALKVAELDAREQALGAQIGRAVFDVYGTGVTPDATFTLRFSDGRARGYDYNGTRAPWRTVFHGMFARCAEFNEEYPFDLPLAWMLAKDKLDLQASVNYVCTVDSTGGNSGSPLIDRDQNIVGLLFDGNIESLGNEFYFEETEGQRSVCVHPQGIIEALSKVYGAHHVVRELRQGR